MEGLPLSTAGKCTGLLRMGWVVREFVGMARNGSVDLMYHGLFSLNVGMPLRKTRRIGVGLGTRVRVRAHHRVGWVERVRHGGRLSGERAGEGLGTRKILPPFAQAPGVVPARVFKKLVPRVVRDVALALLSPLA